ncbi:NAD(P)-binding protein [Caulobacter segnis]|uniref:NAD(P)/FAD-dependent oxidoreductase n=1 Tax=Caulobacter segnis TaxID=88688 RepID=UPI00240F4D4D|nr:NAD(P)/FAD-dependent oxidoreductase [Caulobacter segnis]MDG2522829.1 NAD(P)-binding protein [Caulobacter segnis]
MEKKVRIVGGGMTGILAAFEAHRLGFRDITLFERLEGLGGVARSKTVDGFDIRDGAYYFGDRNDPARRLLEAYGLEFVESPLRYGSVSPAADGGMVAMESFGGPVLPSDTVHLRPLGAGDSLADRIAAYPACINEAIERYCAWHVGEAASALHVSAVATMGLRRVFPAGCNIDALAALKQGDPTYDDLYGIPRELWGRTSVQTGAMPVSGYVRFFDDCRRALTSAGVRVSEGTLVSPRQALAEVPEEEVLVWAGNPTPLFKAMHLPTPRPRAKLFHTHVFHATFDGPAPFFLHNFTAQGVVFRAFLYESAGEVLLTAECVAEADDGALRQELQNLVGLFGRLSIGNQLASSVAPRWGYQPPECVNALTLLRSALNTRFGTSFVPGAWEAYAKVDKLSEISAALSRALTPAETRLTA